MDAQGTEEAHEAEDDSQIRHQVGDELEERGHHDLVPLNQHKQPGQPQQPTYQQIPDPATTTIPTWRFRSVFIFVFIFVYILHPHLQVIQ
jgi:hypothetical protein